MSTELGQVSSNCPTLGQVSGYCPIENTALIAGKSVDPKTGLLIEEAGCFTNWEPVELAAGSTIAPAREGIKLRISCYENGFDETLVRSYAYDEESNWTTFLPEESPDRRLDDSEDPWACPADRFVRITACLPPGTPEPSVLADVASIQAVPIEHPQLPKSILDEIDRVSSRVEELREPGDLVLVLLSDIHYATGCIWPDTARTVQAVASSIHPDAIVQLGDLTDGIAPARVTASFVSHVLDDLHVCGVPVLGCIGNHDTNYFKGNAEQLSAIEAARLCTGRDDLWYFEDFPASKVRCFFLKSFDHNRKERYGYEAEQVKWLRRELRRTPRGWQVLVFSHLTLHASLHWWSKTIMNEGPLMRVLERFNWWRRGALAAFIHGHSHVDQVYHEDSFPCVSIGCTKFEDFQECKPWGSVTPSREMGTASQELWDVLILKQREPRLQLIRFGAGDDRSVTCYDRAR